MGVAESKVEIASEVLPEEIEDDLRVRRWRARLMLQPKDLERLYWSPYMMYQEGDRGMARKDFFKWLGEPETEVGNAMLNFVEPANEGFISYGELLEVLCIFCRFSHRQLVHFIFLYLDDEKQHFVALDVLRHYIQRSHADGGSFQINHAFKILSTQVKGELVSLDECLAFDHQFPYMFFPSSKILTALMKKSYGERFWDFKRELIVDENAIAALRQAPEEDDDLYGEGAVKKRMGSWYWWTPWKREYYRLRLRKMQIIDKELDDLVDAMWRVTKPHWVRTKADYTASDQEDASESEPEELDVDEQLPLPSMLQTPGGSPEKDRRVWDVQEEEEEEEEEEVGRDMPVEGHVVEGPPM